MLSSTLNYIQFVQVVLRVLDIMVFSLIYFSTSNYSLYNRISKTAVVVWIFIQAQHLNSGTFLLLLYHRFILYMERQLFLIFWGSNSDHPRRCRITLWVLTNMVLLTPLLFTIENLLQKGNLKAYSFSSDLYLYLSDWPHDIPALAMQWILIQNTVPVFP